MTTSGHGVVVSEFIVNLLLDAGEVAGKDHHGTRIFFCNARTHALLTRIAKNKAVHFYKQKGSFLQLNGMAPFTAKEVMRRKARWAQR